MDGGKNRGNRQAPKDRLPGQKPAPVPAVAREAAKPPPNSPPAGSGSSAAAPTLRQRAEAKARADAADFPRDLDALSPQAARQALHELRVHQIELEMQNEELREALTERDTSQARYFDLYDLAPVSYVTLNESGLILQANLTAARLLGVPRGALAGQQIGRFILQADQDAFYLHGKRVVESGAMQACELRMTRHDGSQFWAHLDTVAVTDAAGAPALRTVVSDVTDRHRTEAILRTRLRLSDLGRAGNTDQLLKLALDGGTDELLQVALDAAEQITGSSIGFFHFVDPDQEQLTLQAWSTNTLAHMCTAEGKGRHYPISEAGVWAECFRTRAPAIHNDYASVAHKKGMPAGHATVIRELVVPIIRAGKVTEIIGVGNKASDYLQADVEAVQAIAGTVQDLVERIRAEDALRASEERYRRLHESLTDAFVMTDMAGRLVAHNGAYGQMLGYSPEELQGLTYVDLTPEKWRAMEARIVAEQVIPLGQSEVYEKEYVRKDGKVIPVELRIFLLHDGQDRPEAMWAIVRDISERKRVEAELDGHRHHLETLVLARTAELAAARNAAEAANRAKSAFLANMSHEIRTPMNAILGMAYLVRRGGVSPRQAAQLDKIDAAGRHLVDIIDNILDLARIEAGKVVLESKDFTLAELLQRVTAAVDDDLRAKGLELRVDTDGVPPLLHGDGTRLGQALVNYLGNAVKFTERGSIALEARLVERTDTDCLLRFAVTDTGIGVPEGARGQLFKPFQQVDDSFTRAYGGTGLGLAIVKRIAGLMGGDAGFDSTPGHGSRFWLTVRLGLPVAAAALPETAESAQVVLRRDPPGAR